MPRRCHSISHVGELLMGKPAKMAKTGSDSTTRRAMVSQPTTCYAYKSLTIELLHSSRRRDHFARSQVHSRPVAHPISAERNQVRRTVTTHMRRGVHASGKTHLRRVRLDRLDRSRTCGPDRGLVVWDGERMLSDFDGFERFKAIRQSGRPLAESEPGLPRFVRGRGDRKKG